MNYNELPTKILVGHTDVASQLSRRLIQLKAARTLWHKDMNQFMDHVIRVNCDALTYDVFPWIIGEQSRSSEMFLLVPLSPVGLVSVTAVTYCRVGISYSCYSASVSFLN